MLSLSVKNISKTFPDGTEALKGINFDVKAGEGVVLLGHNGSGKSTLFRCISQFEKPTDGQIYFNDQEATKLSKRKLRPLRKRIGMVFQHFHLIPNLSVHQNVLFGALGQTNFSMQTFAPFASKELRLEAMECLDRVGLSHLAKRRADQLSGGQQQRVAIARMLMQKPEIVLADEPIASLDPKAGREVMELLWSITRERNLTIIAILHQMDIAMEFGERIIALKKGDKVIDAPVDEINRQQLEDLYEHDPTISDEEISKVVNS
ncbi:phosphonate ABC transporter ATP-binding protein [Bacillus sp. FJAT-45037]|uniref:phosphonate ABC transporter ATP-binding protein n=1 Tax=Bacillus sp. FJAT-45037 TaxID=2011007 RepID=UPI000C23C88A|nr:phosphonate ABC transporter ATP-binding protein [Bacillus sp. FJAT-45037]